MENFIVFLVIVICAVDGARWTLKNNRHDLEKANPLPAV